MEEVKYANEGVKKYWASADAEERRKQAERLLKGRLAKPGCNARTGIPSGMTKDIAKRFKKQARFEATLTMKKLDKVGALEDFTPEAREALHAALEVMRTAAGLTNAKEKLAAARLVLDFTKAKPASKSEITVNKAEEWLAAVTEANEKADQGDAGDAEASA